MTADASSANGLDMTNCPADSDLDRYHAGELTEPEEARVRRHLAECEACARRDAELVAEQEELIGRLRGNAYVVDGSQSGDPDEVPAMTETQSLSVSRQPAEPEVGPAPVIPDYEPIKCVGRGGFGAVWLAKQRLTGVWYAVKVIPKTQVGQIELDGVRAHKQRAAGHPNLVHLEHVGETAECYYYVMELADDARGPGVHSPEGYEAMTLSEELRRRGKLAVDEAVGIVGHILDGLQHLHEAGLLHRDVKPANIIRQRGQWKLGDMGLVTSHSKAGDAVGTPAYSPPEGVKDRTGDLFCAGVVLAQLITGTRPEPGVLPSSRDLRDSGSAAGSIHAILVRACHREPESRFQTAEQMRDALRSTAGAIALPGLARPGQTRGGGEVPPLLPYLTDRNDQDHVLRLALREVDANSEQRPLICIIHGDEYQCEDMFLERLKHVTLPRLLKLRPSETQVQSFFVRWPGGSGPRDDLGRRILSNVAEAVTDDPDAPIDEVAKVVARRRGVSIIHTHLLTEDWKLAGPQALRAVIEVFSVWPALPRNQHLLACIFVKYQSARSGGWLARLRGARRLNDHIRRHLANLDDSGPPSARVVVLPELTDVSRQEAEDWARDEARSYGFGQDLTHEIRNLYDRLGQSVTRRGLPMELLATELRTVLSRRLVSGRYER
ncbi:MAG: protein kinase [Planctomycetes bacterium]|nr:protein kinase [Planctomycetota bacterium]